MRPSERRKWKKHDEPSPRELREMRERGEWIDEEDDEPIKKAPLAFRVLAWVSLIAIFFAVGYGATSLVFKWMDGGGGQKTPSNLVASQEDAADLLARAKSADEVAASSNIVTCTLSIPEGGAFVSRQIQCSAGLREDTMKQALSAYMDAVKESSMLDPTTQNINLFQSGDWLYLNMNAKFLESLNKLGAEKSRFLITGMVKTMADNFSPVSKIKFYVDGKEVRDKKPVDLTAAWGI
ncbi:GerMN domain-containing protein [Synergistaceae bacterium OttesenSCG-928-I11]|nr:GerMN domain-containing protein [Synergistaceae bacterium OttesenSCG-928-I11]